MVGLLLSPSDAGAVERQWYLGASTGYAFVDMPGGDYDGVDASIRARYGLTDAFDLTFELGAPIYPLGERVIPTALAGVSYVVDVMQIVPHVGASVGFADTIRWECPDEARAAQLECGHAPHFALMIPTGIEYRFTRSFAAGGYFRGGFLFAGNFATEMAVGLSVFYTTDDSSE